MKKTLKLTSFDWSYGSYIRKSFRTDIIYTIIQYKEMDAFFNRNLGRLMLHDRLVEQMLRDHLITDEQKIEFENEVIEAFDPLTKFDNSYIEDLYGLLHKKRKDYFGIEIIEKEQYSMTQREIEFDPSGGIDQTEKKKMKIDECESAIFVLTNPEYFFLMKKDIDEVIAAGKEVYIVTGEEQGETVPARSFMENLLLPHEKIHYLTMACRNGGLNLQGISWDEELQRQISKNETFFIVYGEEGLLSCRLMLIDSIVYGIPSGYFTRTVTNQFGVNRACVVFAPKRFDITRWVGIWRRTRISYWHLARLWEVYGDEIYKCTPDELYLKYPQYFINVYADGRSCVEAAEDYPIQITWPEDISERYVMRQFDMLKDNAVEEYLNGFDNIEYVATYFTEEMEQTQIPWFHLEQQTGILVQAVRVGNVRNSYVVSCDGKTVRKIMGKDNQDGYPLKLVSNFLFFLTPRLAQVYNELRKDQPREQIRSTGGHLDYMLCYENGKRIETFPLFRKACIGMMKNGQYLFFNYQLGGGNITINGAPIRWEKTGVNTDQPEKVSVYTPFYAKEDANIVLKEYKMPVGEDHINIVLAQNEIVCIRKGPVALSSIGVVISMDKELGEQFLEQINAKPLEDGYYECESYDITVELDRPETVTKEQWDQLSWAYGGGLSLILDGKGLCDGNEEDMLKMLAEEGWMSALSRQTQESAIHELAKHPRTAIGVTKDGDLVVFVYSGRTSLSVGADYKEMISIAREIFPDIWSMMNVDGGGSSVLGMVVGNSFMELSYPATSVDNCAGMVRPINTILCLEP